MQSNIRVDRNIPMEMRDSTILRADVYRPEDNQKHPAILIRTPYNKLLERGHFLDAVDVAFAGYAVVIQDVRGRFASEGQWAGDISEGEGLDGYDSVEWIASQPWCDGNVGTQGLSYPAHLQWITAMETPPHLKAMAPAMGGMGRIMEGAGVPRLSQAVEWTTMMAVDAADRLAKQGKDVSQMRSMIDQALHNPEEVINYLPLKDIPLFQFEGVREMWNGQLRLSVPDPRLRDKIFWDYKKVKVPCFHVSGWYDICTFGTFYAFLNMQENGGSQRAREGQHVLMGPWIHGQCLPDCVGDMNFGMSSRARGAQATAQHIAFYNKYLRGMDIKVPTIRYFLMGSNMWQEADTWPLPQTQWQRFFLHSQGRANTSDGDGLLNRDEPRSEPPDIFIYNPQLPVQAAGGRNVPLGVVAAGPVNQFHIEQRNDVLCYSTPELEEDTEVTGPLELHLFSATSARDTDFTATFVDVYPDGRAYNIANGVIRARYRKSVFEPELVQPGDANEYIISMGNTSNLFRKGHRIRIDISSSSFPAFDRNMNTGNPPGEDAQGIPAMQTVYHHQRYASFIDLPVIPVKPV
jgi:putative CocE/NonD family hydrolase